MLSQSLFEDAVKLYSKSLQINSTILDYLIKERGITKRSIEKFELGYCYGHEVSSISDSCFLVKGNKDYFSEYIVFPIRDGDGKLVNIYGRSITKEKKHLLLPHITKENLYNPNALNKQHIVIVEGTIDAITMDQTGFNAVGLMGAHLKKECKKYFVGKNVYVFLDKDNAGRIGTSAITNLLLDVTKELRVIVLPNISSYKEDANSYFLLNREMFRDRILFLVKKSLPIKQRIFPRTIRRKKKCQPLEDKIDIIKLGKKLFKRYDDRGSSLWLRCPFHSGGNETVSSLQIGGKSNIFYCYGCHVGGGPVRLVYKAVYSYLCEWKGTEKAKVWIRERFIF